LDTVLPWSISHLQAPVVRGLFQRRIRGDDAILRLAQLRFAESGMAAELYADTSEQLEHELRFLPPQPALPIVRLNRHVNLCMKMVRAWPSTLSVNSEAGSWV
jgi:hypothetical protein